MISPATTPAARATRTFVIDPGGIKAEEIAQAIADYETALFSYPADHASSERFRVTITVERVEEK